MKTILVPTDFSDNAEHASDFAAEIAHQNGSELCFIHVVEIPAYPDSEYYLNHQVVQTMMTDAEHKLKGVSKKYHDKVADVKTFVTTSTSLDGIKEGILSINADLIIMGKHDQVGGIDEFLIDNNTEKIIRYSKCPVISVNGPVQVSHWKKAVVAIDPSACYDELLNEVHLLSEFLQLNPHFIWIAQDAETHTIQNISLLKDTIGEHYGKKNIRFSSAVAEKIPEGILKLSNELDASMVFISSHGRKGLKRLIEGSVAEKVVQSSDLPTVVIQLQKESDHKMKISA